MFHVTGECETLCERTGQNEAEKTPEKAVLRNTKKTINKNKGIPFNIVAFFFLLSTFLKVC